MSVQCPFCKFNIPSDAYRCPHCTSDLTGFQNARINDNSQMVGTFVVITLLSGLQWCGAWAWSKISGKPIIEASFYWAFAWIFKAFMWAADIVQVIFSWPLHFFNMELYHWAAVLILSILLTAISQELALAIVIGPIIGGFLLLCEFIYR